MSRSARATSGWPAYVDGWWDSDNLSGLLTLLAKSRDVLQEAAELWPLA